MEIVTENIIRAPPLLVCVHTAIAVYEGTRQKWVTHALRKSSRALTQPSQEKIT